jgi:hypothetical protein
VGDLPSQISQRQRTAIPVTGGATASAITALSFGLFYSHFYGESQVNRLLGNAAQEPPLAPTSNRDRIGWKVDFQREADIMNFVRLASCRTMERTG